MRKRVFVIVLSLLLVAAILPAASNGIQTHRDANDTIFFYTVQKVWKGSSQERHLFGKSLEKDQPAAAWIRVELAGGDFVGARFADSAELKIDDRRFILYPLSDYDSSVFNGLTGGNDNFVTVGVYELPPEVVAALIYSKKQVSIHYSFKNQGKETVLHRVADAERREWIKIAGMTRQDYEK